MNSGAQPPLFIQLYEFSQVLMPWADVLVLIKIVQFVIIYGVFEYHRLVTTKPQFQRLFPVLYSKLDKKTYNNFKWFYATVPVADWYFFYRLYQQRDCTVNFMKDYGVKERYPTHDN